MKDLSIKKNVLQEIMDLMDAREGEDLKKHPKFAPKMEEKPEMALGEESEVEEAAEEVPFGEKPEAASGDSELSDEDLQMLLEKFKEMQ